MVTPLPQQILVGSSTTTHSSTPIVVIIHVHVHVHIHIYVFFCCFFLFFIISQ